MHIYAYVHLYTHAHTFLCTLNRYLKFCLCSLCATKSWDKSVYADIELQKLLKENHYFLNKFSALFVARCQFKHFCRAIFVAQREHKQSFTHKYADLYFESRKNQTIV